MSDYNANPTNFKPQPWVDPKPVNDCPEAPLLSLLTKPMEDMSDEELRAHVQTLRTSAANGHSFAKEVRAPKAAKKTAVKKHPTIDASKYMSFGDVDNNNADDSTIGTTDDTTVVGRVVSNPNFDANNEPNW